MAMEIEPLIYLSAKTAEFFDNPRLFGCMFSYRKTGRQDEALKAGCRWMLDNGAFTNNFVFSTWVYQLAMMRPYRANCIGIVTPDVPYNAAETLHRFSQYRAIPEALGYKVAFATQDGMTADMIPWPLFNVLFIGGSDQHKRGPDAEELAREAKRQGKWVHVGRVSSVTAARRYWTWADSADGTTFCFEAGEARDRLFIRWSGYLSEAERPVQWRLL
jgi:hypothetical protein